jgi:iron complex outermembrane receptor protein
MHATPTTARYLAARRLLAGTALCASLAATGAAEAAAAAGDQEQTSSGGLAEITVTAERRTENLIKTPISISVVSDRDMENRHIYSLTDLNDGSAPGLRVMPYANRPFNMILNIRGVGIMSDTNQPAQESGVGVYVDGVYLGRPQGLDAGLYDLESVEVLKGPQGTLFGRNTEAGALNIRTKRPTGRFGLEMIGGVGNYGSYESQFHLNLPTWHNLAFKVDGMIMARDGWVKNPMPGQADWNAVDRRGVRAQAQWTPSPDFTANYTFDVSHTEVVTIFNYTVKAASGPGTIPIAAATPVVNYRIGEAPLGVPLQPSIGDQFGHSLHLSWDVAPWLTLKSISSYRELDQNQYSNPGTVGLTAPTTASALQFARYSLAKFDQYQYSEEVQALGEAGRWKYIFGAMGYHEKVYDQAQAFYSMQWDAVGAGYSARPISYGPTGNSSGILSLNNFYGQPGQTALVKGLYPNIGVDRASWNVTDSFGVYGQATYTPPLLNDIVHVTGGLRWNDDRKHGHLYVVNNAQPVRVDNSVGPIDFVKSWKRVDPMVNVAADIAGNALLYGKWATGYRAGGANSRSLTYKPFDPETVSMFEVGFKGEFFDRHARVNIAGYTGTYKDVAYHVSAPYYTYNPDGTVNTKTPRTTEDTLNMPGKGRISGVETDFMIAPLRGLTVSGSYTYAYVRMPNFVNPYPTYVNVGGVVLEQYSDPTIYHQLYTPEHAATGAVDYSGDLGGYTLRVHVDGNWNSGYYTSSSDINVGKDANGKTLYLGQMKSQPGIIFNTRLSVGDIDLAGSGAKLNVAFWVRNLFNAEFLTTRSGSYTRAASTVTGAFNDPRTFGGTLGVKF